MFYLQVEMKGLTGTIKFDQHGLRTDFTLEVVELKKDGLVKVIFATCYIQLVLSLKDAPSKRKVFFRATTAKVFFSQKCSFSCQQMRKRFYYRLYAFDWAQKRKAPLLLLFHHPEMKLYLT